MHAATLPMDAPDMPAHVPGNVGDRAGTAGRPTVRVRVAVSSRSIYPAGRPIGAESDTGNVSAYQRLPLPVRRVTIETRCLILVRFQVAQLPPNKLNNLAA